MLTDQAYQRHLPHQIPQGFPIFLTWCLKGAVTRAMLDSREQERERLQKQPVQKEESAEARHRRQTRLLFGHLDQLLGRADRGPLFLADPPAAQIVVDSFLFGVPARYALFAFVVMGNHVHVVLTPAIPLPRITQGIKGYTSHQINELHGQKGRIVWQDESYDHWVRDEAELLRVIAYIENNPVIAGLCTRPEDWVWSSAHLRGSWPIGQPYTPTAHA
jgi:type I restriction enzyme R subunit